MMIVWCIIFSYGPDIAYAIGVVSQFMHNPKEVHLWTKHRILKFLKGTLGKRVFSKLTLEANTNVDYVGSIDGKKSTLGYCTFLEVILTMRWSKN